MCSSHPQRQHGCDQSAIFEKCVTNRWLLQTVVYCCPSLWPQSVAPVCGPWVDVPPECFSAIVEIDLKLLHSPLHLSHSIIKHKMNEWIILALMHVWVTWPPSQDPGFPVLSLTKTEAKCQLTVKCWPRHQAFYQRTKPEWKAWMDQSVSIRPIPHL